MGEMLQQVHKENLWGLVFPEVISDSHQLAVLD